MNTFLDVFIVHGQSQRMSAHLRFTDHDSFRMFSFRSSLSDLIENKNAANFLKKISCRTKKHQRTLYGVRGYMKIPIFPQGSGPCDQQSYTNIEWGAGENTIASKFPTPHHVNFSCRPFYISKLNKMK